MNKTHLIPLIPLFLGVICFGAYTIIGSGVSPDGSLAEPFYLLPLGWFFFLSATLLAFIIGVRTLLKHDAETSTTTAPTEEKK